MRLLKKRKRAESDRVLEAHARAVRAAEALLNERKGTGASKYEAVNAIVYASRGILSYADVYAIAGKVYG